jgi:FtsH-binding integral membrane protein
MNTKLKKERIITMLYTIAIVLVALWLLGLVTSYTMSGFIHILLMIAIVVVLIRLIQGRNVLGTKI